MPTYQYRCTECGNDLEAVQKFSDPSLTECPVCHGQLRKVFNAVGVVFKGSGFYRTDSRKQNGSAEGSSDSSGKSGSDQDKGSSDKRSKTDTSPASAQTPTASGSTSSSSGTPGPTKAPATAASSTGSTSKTS